MLRSNSSRAGAQINSKIHTYMAALAAAGAMRAAAALHADRDRVSTECAAVIVAHSH